MLSYAQVMFQRGVPLHYILHLVIIHAVSCNMAAYRECPTRYSRHLYLTCEERESTLEYKILPAACGKNPGV